MRAGRGGRKVWVERQEGGGLGAREGSGCEAGQALHDNGTLRKKTEGPLHSLDNPARAHPPTHPSPRGQTRAGGPPRPLHRHPMSNETCLAVPSAVPASLPPRPGDARSCLPREAAAFSARRCLTARGVAAARQQKRAPAPAARAMSASAFLCARRRGGTHNGAEGGDASDHGDRCLYAGSSSGFTGN